ncbi:MAG TPA: universal stress protein [Longimicrobiaceae bacterium]|nr:universal stress protein [Longimicrobiaceae bacterium]
MWLLTLKSILVATDLTDSSRPALRTAASLAPLAGTSLHLLYVADDPKPDDEARLREQFRIAAPDAPEPDSVRVIVGSPAAAIVQHAVEVDADALILGPHRRTGMPGEMGSTAANVVRNAPCPCLVAAADLRLPLERVIAPIDLSEVASGALSVALSWASALRPRPAKANLTALHVTTNSASRTAEQAVREEVEQARTRAGGAAHVDIREMIAHHSDPVEEILRTAASESADLLVMGTRDEVRSVSDLGSVAAAVARRTQCPLLLVPPAT